MKTINFEYHFGYGNFSFAIQTKLYMDNKELSQKYHSEIFHYLDSLEPKCPSRIMAYMILRVKRHIKTVVRYFELEAIQHVKGLVANENHQYKRLFRR